jgi:hypothetical protein
MLRILYHGTKIEANSWNSVLIPSAEEKTTRNFVPWNKNRRKLSEVRPKHVFNENMLFILFPRAGFFVTITFFMSFPSVPGLGIDSSGNLGMLRNEHFLPRNNETHSESIPRNFFGTKFRCQPYFTTLEQRWASKPYLDFANHKLANLYDHSATANQQMS